MGSETPLPLRLPVIDFSSQKLKQGTAEWDLVRADVRKALEEYGSFEASCNRIPIELRRAIFGCLKELFDQPLQTKQRNVSSEMFLGYMGQHPMAPLYESMGIEEADTADNVDAFANMIWPQGNEHFSKTIQSFVEQVSELDTTIRRMIMESFGLERYMDEHLESTNYLLRMIKYKGPDTEEKKRGLKAHTDKNIVTILYQNDVQGFEVQTKDNKWIEVKPSQYSFTVMIGDCLYALLNGRLYSPHHRVMMMGKETRYSVGLFSIPKAGYIIDAPEDVVDDEHPRLFKPFDHAKFLRFYHTEAAQRDTASALKTYCGV